MKNALRILIGGLTIALISSCSDPKPPITEGTVVDREFTAEHWESGYRSEPRYGYHCGLGHDGSTNCGMKHYTASVYDPHYRWHDNEWRIQIDGCVEYDDDGELKEHCDTRWIDVSEAEYDRFQIGVHYPNPA